MQTPTNQPGRPRKCSVKQVTTSTGLSPFDAWSVATDRSAWTVLRPVDGQAERERDHAQHLSFPTINMNPTADTIH